MVANLGPFWVQNGQYVLMAAYAPSETADILLTLYSQCAFCAADHGILSAVVHPGGIDSEPQRHTKAGSAGKGEENRMVRMAC